MVGSLVRGTQRLGCLLDLLHGLTGFNLSLEGPVECAASFGFLRTLLCGVQPCAAAAQGSLVINHDDDPGRLSLHGQAHKVVGVFNGSASDAGALHEVSHVLNALLKGKIP
nr:hypothetical protein [Kocuria sp. ZOR0020]